MPQRLEDIQPGEVSLVKRGANRRRFLLAKSGEVEFDETVAKVLETPADNERDILDAVEKAGGDDEVAHVAAAVIRAWDALPAEIRKAMKPQMADAEDENDDDETDENGDGSEDYDELAKSYEQILKREFTAEQRKKLADSGAALPNGSYPIENVADLKNAIHAVGRGSAPHAQIRAHIEARAKALGAEDQLPDEWKVNKEDTDMTDTATVPVQKEDGTWDLSGVPEDARAAVEAVIKAQDDEREQLRKAAEVEKSKADEAIAIAKAEREHREKREYIAKSEGYTNLAKSDDEFGEILYSLAKAERDGALPEGTVEKLDTVLKAANEAAANVFKEYGRAGHGTGSSDATSKLDAAAAEIRKADTSLSEAQAIAKALKQDPSLYDEYQKAVA